MAAIVPPGSQSCTVSTIRWRLGSGLWDPFVRQTSDQVAMWLSLWRGRHIEGIEMDLRRSWRHAMAELFFTKKAEATKDEEHKEKKFHEPDWGKVTGPISATVASLARARWRPAAPDHWLTADGKRSVQIDEAAHVKPQLLHALQVDLEDQAW